MEIEFLPESSISWNEEYRRQGIPSSHREQPSSVLEWSLANIPFLSDEAVHSAIDLGCGTGRNTIALAKSGLKKVDGIDFSSTALEVARKRPDSHLVNFSQGDVTKLLPYDDKSFDYATDIFVYFHQLSDQDRATYRKEIHRILKPRGILLVSLATNADGYYSSCSIGPLARIQSSVQLTWDPNAKVGNILLSRNQFFSEFSDLFNLQMFWTKHKHGKMHGKRYLRETVATLWNAKV